MHNIAFTATDASKILTFPKANYLKYQVMEKLLKSFLFYFMVLPQTRGTYHKHNRITQSTKTVSHTVLRSRC